jgi:putative endonuclease
MKTLGTHNYFVYITTNVVKTVLYTGVTNELKNRLYWHKDDAKNRKEHFAGKYNAYYLVYYERFQNVDDAILREKQIKGWSRKKKEMLIESFNPEWKFLNEII